MATKSTKTVKSKKPTKSAPPVSKKGNPVSKSVKVQGKRTGSVQASRQKSQQKRRDSR